MTMLFLTPDKAKQLPLPIAPFVFWKTWGNDEWQGRVSVICSEFNSGTNPRKIWNSVGREKLQVTRCKRFAYSLSKALVEVGCSSMLAGHYELSRVWMPSNVIHHKKYPAFVALREVARDYLRHTMPNLYQGAVILETPQEIRAFLEALLAYPTVFSYLSLYLFCTDIPIVVEIGHHANVLIYAKSQQILTPLREKLT